MAEPKVRENVYPFPHRERDREPGHADLAGIIATQTEIARAGLDVKKLVDVITSRSQVLTGSTGAVVEMLDGDELLYWSGSGTLCPHVGLRIPASGSLSGLCIAQDAFLTCHDSEADARVNIEACRQVGLRSALVTPLRCEGNLVGVLKVISPEPHAYSARHVEILQTLASFMGSTLNSALEHARLSALVDKAAMADNQALATRRLELSRINSLIEARGIRPVFQPIVEMGSGKVVGHEALSRFDAPDNLRTNEWFDMADRVGMGFELEVACLSAIMETVASAPGLAGYISFNVSPKTLMEYDFAQLPDRRASGGWVIEITEHSEVKEYANLAQRVKELQAMGFRIAIDDVGAGFASLRHVLKLTPDIVKLDMSLTRDIDKIRRHQLMASAIIAFSSDTGITLVAEGVETAGERETLSTLNVTYGQGYLFGRPSPVGA